LTKKTIDEDLVAKGSELEKEMNEDINKMDSSLT
jgi:hypothetical protein